MFIRKLTWDFETFTLKIETNKGSGKYKYINENEIKSTGYNNGYK